MNLKTGFCTGIRNRVARNTCMRSIACLLSITIPLASLGGEFAGQVLSFSAGGGAGFGAAHFPTNVLGPPNGNSNPNTPNFDEVDLLSLGDGGTIILGFSGVRIVDGPGPDITIFENPVQPIGRPDQSFADTAVVSVSEDGQAWTTFPFDFIPPTTGTLLDRSCYVGFAGVVPSLSSSSNGISPFDPLVSGGDKFDLATIGVTGARFIRIQDTGTTGPTQTVDEDGDIVSDSGALISFGGSVGFDLDAVAALHTAPLTSACPREWMLYE